MSGSLESAASKSSQSGFCSTFCFLRGASGSGASSARRRGGTRVFCVRLDVEFDCVSVRRGATTASEGRFFGITTEAAVCFDARGFDLMFVCFDASGFDSTTDFLTFVTDVFLLMGRRTTAFSVVSFSSTAFVMSPNAAVFL